VHGSEAGRANLGFRVGETTVGLVVELSPAESKQNLLLQSWQPHFIRNRHVKRAICLLIESRRRPWYFEEGWYVVSRKRLCSIGAMEAELEDSSWIAAGAHGVSLGLPGCRGFSPLVEHGRMPLQRKKTLSITKQSYE
jgi:hypothetical protein